MAWNQIAQAPFILIHEEVWICPSQYHDPENHFADQPPGPHTQKWHTMLRKLRIEKQRRFSEPECVGQGPVDGTGEGYEGVLTIAVVLHCASGNLQHGGHGVVYSVQIGSLIPPLVLAG